MKGIPGLSRAFRMRVRLHYTWIVAVPLLTAGVVTQFSTEYVLWQRIILGIAASALFFLAIMIREFILSYIAVSKGITVNRITIFAFGGVREIAQESTLPSLELLMAVAGLLSNLIIGGIFSLAYFGLASTGNIIINVLIQWMAFICFMQAVFHFAPGFPLDGGRALRALLWKTTNNFGRATIITSWIGWGIGVLTTLGGIMILVTTQQWFAGVLMAFPGLVLQNAATHTRRQISHLTPGPPTSKAVSLAD
jgi:Zn-dependent protease